MGKVAARLRPGVRLSKQARSVLSDLVATFFLAPVMRNANAFVAYHGKATLSPAVLRYAVRAAITDPALRDAVSTKAASHVKTFNASFA